MNPKLSADVAGITSSSDFRFKSEYSFCAQVIAALPNIGFCSVADLASCQPLKLQTLTYLAFPELVA